MIKNRAGILLKPEEIEELPPNVRSKWSQFTRLIVCPVCGDDTGHAGILPDGKWMCIKDAGSHFGWMTGPRIGGTETEYKSAPLGQEEAEILDAAFKNLLHSLDKYRDKTREYFTNERGYNKKTTETLLNKGYMYYKPRKSVKMTIKPAVWKVLVKHPAFKGTPDQKQVELCLPKKECLLFPVRKPFPNFPDGLIIDLRVRYFEQVGRNKYAWLSKGDTKTPHYPRPKYTYCAGVDSDVLLVTEGELKAEVASIYMGYDAIGLTGGTNLARLPDIYAELGKEYSDVFIASDTDVFTRSQSLALGTVVGTVNMIWQGFPEPKFLLWGTSPTVKGIDDYLLASHNTPFSGIFKDWWNTVTPPVQEHILKNVHDDAVFNSLLSDEVTHMLDRELDTLSIRNYLDPVIIKCPEERIERIAEEFYTNRINMVVDTSQTGSGKSYAIAEHVDMLLEAGAKRVVYISQSPVNPPIDSMNEWPVMIGRTQFGFAKDAETGKYRERTLAETLADDPKAEYPANCTQRMARVLAENNMYELQAGYCEQCYDKETCPFREFRQEARKMEILRSSFASYVAIPGDFVVVDEISSLTPIVSVPVAVNDLKRFQRLLYDCSDRLVTSGGILTDDAVLELDKRLGTVLRYVRELLARYPDKKLHFMSAPDIRRDLDVALRMDTGVSLEEWLRPVEQYLSTTFLQRVDKLLSKKEVGDIMAAAIMGDSEEIPQIFVDLKALMELFGIAAALLGGNGYSLSYIRGKLSLTYRDNRVLEFLNKVEEGQIKLLVLDASANAPYYNALFKNLRVKYLAFADSTDEAVRPKIIGVSGLGSVFQGTYEEGVKQKVETAVKLNKALCDRYGLQLRKPGMLTLKKFEKYATRAFVHGHEHADNLGSNKFYEAGVNVLFLLGVPLPNLAEHIASAEVLYGQKLLPGTAYYNGSQMLADPIARELLKASLDASYIQAIGRVRANRREDPTVVVVMDEFAKYITDETLSVEELLPDDLQVSVKKDFTKRKRHMNDLKLVMAHRKGDEKRTDFNLLVDRTMLSYAAMGGIDVYPELFGIDERKLYKGELRKRFGGARQVYHDNFTDINEYRRVTAEEKREFFSRLFAMDAQLAEPLYRKLSDAAIEAVLGLNRKELDELEKVPILEARRLLSKAKHTNGLPPAHLSGEPRDFNTSDYAVMPAHTEEIEDKTYYVANWCGALDAIRALTELTAATEHANLLTTPARTPEETDVLKNRVLALDIETARRTPEENRLFLTGYEKSADSDEGPNVGKDVIRILSITHIASGITYVFDLFKVFTGADNEEFVTTLQTILDTCLVLGHNLLFDMHYLRHHYGLEITNPYCTFTLMEYLQSYHGYRGLFQSLGLASLVETLLDREMPKEMQLSNWNVPALTAEQKKYAAMDTKIYVDLLPKLQQIVHGVESSIPATGRENYALRLLGANALGDKTIDREMQTLVPLADMASYGTPIDLEVLEKQIVSYTHLRNTAIDRLAEAGMAEPTRTARVYSWVLSFGLEGVEELLKADNRGKKKKKKGRKKAGKTLFPEEVSDKETETDEGDYSVDETALLRVQEHALAKKEGADIEKALACDELFAAIKLLLEFRSLTKTVDKLKEVKKHTIAGNNVKTGRVYSPLNTFGAVTGRMSSRKPNLQNLGRGEIREIVSIEGAPGKVLVGADLPQIELRIAGRISGDKTMLDAFREGKDLHKITAAAVTGKKVEDVTKEERQLAKAVNFGFLYGMREHTFVTHATNQYGVEMDLARAKEIRDRYFKTYGGLAEWHNRARQQAWNEIELDKAAVEDNVTETHVQTLAGRTIGMTVGNYFRMQKQTMDPDGNIVSDGSYDAGNLTKHILNYQDQGTGADIIKDALIRFWRNLKAAGLEAHVVNVVHDEVLVECDDKDREAVGKLLSEAMESAAVDILNLPVPVDTMFGRHWGEVH